MRSCDPRTIVLYDWERADEPSRALYIAASWRNVTIPARGAATQAPEHRHVVVSQRLVVINAASSLIKRVLSATVLFWMYRYLLTRISPEEFAIYPVLVALMAFAPLFFSMFTGGVSRHIVEACALGEPRRVAEIISSIVPLIALASGIFLLVGLVAAVFIEDILTIAVGMEDEARLMLVLLVVNYALQMLMLPFATGHHVRQRFVELNMIGVMSELLRIVLLVVFLIGIGPSVLWVVVARVVAEQTNLAVVLFRSRQLVPEAKFWWGLFRWDLARKLVSFGVWTSVGQLALLAVTDVGTLILNGFGSALDVTVYHLGASLFKQINGVIALAAFPLLPAMTAMHALEDRQRLARTTLRGARYGLWVALFAACPLAIYSREFVELYLGEKYSSAALVVSLFMTIFVFKQGRTLLPFVAMATAEVRPYHLGSFVSSGIALVLVFWLVAVQGLGAFGVALGLLLVTAMSELVYFWPLQLRLIRARLRDFVTAVLVRGMLPAAAASLVWASLGFLSPPETWLELVGLGAAGAIVYVLVLASLCLDKNEPKGSRSHRQPSPTPPGVNLISECLPRNSSGT